MNGRLKPSMITTWKPGRIRPIKEVKSVPCIEYGTNQLVVWADKPMRLFEDVWDFLENVEILDEDRQ